MMPLCKNLLALLAGVFLLLPEHAAAQLPTYAYANHVQVYEGTRRQTTPFGGGLSNTQFASADLNQDGKPDLVTFDGFTTEQVRTYINHGTAGSPEYHYEPKYAANFPQLYYYIYLVDYNRDGISDLVHFGSLGFNVSKGYYAHGQLRFQYYKQLRFISATTGTEYQAYVDANDIPGIYDIDNDGDLDFLSFFQQGSYVYMYRNLQQELGLPKDSIRLASVVTCWGRTMQAIARTAVTGITGVCTPYFRPARIPDNTTYYLPEQQTSLIDTTVANRSTMHGGNTLCMLDYDGDGDADYLNGNYSYNDIQLLINGRVQAGGSGNDSMVWQDTAWQGTRRPDGSFNTNPVPFQVSFFPAAFHIDYDGDGRKDILIAPHGGASTDKNQVWLYRNVSATTVPDYRFVKKFALGDEMIDLGSNAYPLFYDYDKDGKKDLLVGATHRTQFMTQVNRLALYRNTTVSGGSPSFSFVTDTLANVHLSILRGVAPAVGDADGDGKDDLIIGREDGTISFYKNTAASNGVLPVWTLTADTMRNPAGDSIRVRASAAPTFYDLNLDSKPDLIVGQRSGILTAFLNTNTTSGQVSYTTKKDSLGGVKVGSPMAYQPMSTPYVGRLSGGSTQEYLLVGNSEGTLSVYDGLYTGNLNLPYTKMTDSFSRVAVSGTATPAVMDMDGDGEYEMVMGTMHGGVQLFWTGGNMGTEAPLVSAVPAVKLFPNPATDKVIIQFAKTEKAILEVRNLLGSRLLSQSLTGSQREISIDTHLWNAGIYEVIIYATDRRETHKLVIVR